MTLVVPVAVLSVGAALAFLARKRLAIVGPFTAATLLAALALLAQIPAGTEGELLQLPLRLSALSRLAALVILALVLVLVLDVWLTEPAYNFFPIALAVAATVIAVLTLMTPLAIYAALLFGLLLPVGSFTFQVHRNRSVEAAIRHFAFVSIGGTLGLAALGLAAGLRPGEAETTFVLLVVILFIAFALKLAAIPFHTHAALLATEAPVAALALYFGALGPATFIAFSEILTLSGLLPAIEGLLKVQQLLLGLGAISALGGALLAAGAADLRRVVIYGVIANLGAALVGLGTFSGPGIVGAIAIALVSGASATQQLLAAGALERAAAPEPPRADRAPLAAAAFIAGGIGLVGAPPLVGFAGRFFVELMAYSFSVWLGAALVGSTVLLVVAQLRAGISIFAGGLGGRRIEPRPVTGALGMAIFAVLLAGGLLPGALLEPIEGFAVEFLRALRPF